MPVASGALVLAAFNCLFLYLLKQAQTQPEIYDRCRLQLLFVHRYGHDDYPKGNLVVFSGAILSLTDDVIIRNQV